MPADRDDPGQLSMVATLTSKAASSAFPEERAAFAARAYRELATYLNALEPARPGQRKRERRLLTDRRQGSAPPTAAAGTPTGSGGQASAARPVDIATAYGRRPRSGEHVFDLRA